MQLNLSLRSILRNEPLVVFSKPKAAVPRPGERARFVPVVPSFMLKPWRFDDLGPDVSARGEHCNLALVTHFADGRECYQTLIITHRLSGCCMRAEMGRVEQLPASMTMTVDGGLVALDDNSRLALRRWMDLAEA